MLSNDLTPQNVDKIGDYVSKLVRQEYHCIPIKQDVVIRKKTKKDVKNVGGWYHPKKVFYAEVPTVCKIPQSTVKRKKVFYCDVALTNDGAQGIMYNRDFPCVPRTSLR